LNKPNHEARRAIACWFLFLYKHLCVCINIWCVVKRL